MGTESNAYQSLFQADAFLDLGEASCATVPITEVASALNMLASGQTLEIRATDITVPIDLKAWCNLTGHLLVNIQGDRLLIQHK